MPDKRDRPESATDILKPLAAKFGNGNGNGRKPLGAGSAVQLGLLVSVCAGAIALTAWAFTQLGTLKLELAESRERNAASHDRIVADAETRRSALEKRIEQRIAEIEKTIVAIRHEEMDCKTERARIWDFVAEVKSNCLTCQAFKAIRDATEAWNKGIGFVAPEVNCK
jgi:hypothetical protein